MNAVGILQGRLSPPPVGRPQAFPTAWRDEFDTARAIGFDSIEWLVTADSLDRNPLLNPDGPGELRDVSGRSGIAVTSVCADCFITMPLVRVPEDVRRDRITLLDRIIERSAAAGLSVVLLPVLEDNALGGAPEASSFVNALTGSLALAGQYGVTVALESDWPASELRSLIDTAESDALGIYYDLGNATALGRNTGTEIRTLGHRLRGVHIKDRRRHGSSVPLGTGEVPWNDAVLALRDAGYDGSVILETPAGSDPHAAAAANLHFIRRAMAGSEAGAA